ncbi:hypothetical protein KIN20_020623 [Parelaphostrongylus tenuis]|uniref:Uncharacterized protein n=1 Tax=Parelaphostrongylus tenuis TaxID=148309 RepID=A0AAD5MRJ1_PARTN|nr:hypothetical protein KIN20_020623 [Parelaphostrongylus tenuis]
MSQHPQILQVHTESLKFCVFEYLMVSWVRESSTNAEDCVAMTIVDSYKLRNAISAENR